ncbi:hypothetical protein V6Z11_A03G138900 [Gossypium hirsutum]
MGKQWFEARIFYKGSEEIEVDVFKKLEKRNMEELGFTHSLIEKLSVGLVAVQVVVAGALVVGAAGLFVGSVVLGLLETLREILQSLLFSSSAQLGLLNWVDFHRGHVQYG